jgi:glyoxylase-like metal-dependent hydrolase (beta-lactamase superfamily II)
MKLSENVHALRVPFTVPMAKGVNLPRFVYCYVLLGDRTWVIDTGVCGSSEQILKFVEELGRPRESVNHILLTHAHIDHIGGASALVGVTGAKVHAHPAERHWLEDIARQNKERPVPGFFELVRQSVRIDEELSDGQLLEIGPNLHLRVLHVPGHSPGGCAFFLEEQKILFSGDAVPVPGDMPVYDDPITSAHSLDRLRQLCPISVLASAWDAPRFDDEAARVLSAGSAFLEQVHHAVRKLRATTDSTELCRAVVAQLGLPPAMANPMVQRTLNGHLACLDRPTVFE